MKTQADSESLIQPSTPSPTVSTMLVKAEPAPIVYLKSMPKSLKKLLGEKPLIAPVPDLSVPDHTIAEKRALLRDGMVVVIDSMHAVLNGDNKYPRGIEKKAW